MSDEVWRNLIRQKNAEIDRHLLEIERLRAEVERLRGPSDTEIALLDRAEKAEAALRDIIAREHVWQGELHSTMCYRKRDRCPICIAKEAIAQKEPSDG